MQELTFLGHIDPSGTTIGVDLAPVHFPETEFGMPITVLGAVSESKITVKCQFPRIFPDHLLHAWVYCTEYAQAAVNLVAFSMGAGITVTLDHFVDSEGQPKPLSHFDPALPSLCTALSKERGYDSCLKLLFAEPRLAIAMNDLIVATTSPRILLVNCARAIEAICNIISSGRKKDWAAMHAAINVDGPYLRLITDHSTAPRHGDPITVSVNIRTEVTKRSWTTMDRFLHYQLRGSTPLPVSEFPVLKG